jgi:hypothetical protein
VGELAVTGTAREHRVNPCAWLSPTPRAECFRAELTMSGEGATLWQGSNVRQAEPIRSRVVGLLGTVAWPSGANRANRTREYVCTQGA